MTVKLRALGLMNPTALIISVVGLYSEPWAITRTAVSLIMQFFTMPKSPGSFWPHDDGCDTYNTNSRP